ncbi:gas vesicle synthesis GvpLGvpF [Brachybacterium endophyticum]|uniref:Gas vesicle synthesis GvpLGvpF n=1 Tax=Brachybacterium endophyticum TaxID=2182385 RepID=A0A2U2RKR1_9MICO|nr:GvpL/GvpF family gas vesicle protein [Brachybacterium endophyticum]PWH06469.1 gas vesicle synthesis GvpLGvpF [Brachybacterium endophyticum]
METDLYLYGIVLADCEAPSVEGVHGHAPRVVGSGSLAALVSDLEPVDALGDPDDLVAHTQVLDALAEAHPVLPMAFGTVLPGDGDIAADLLSPREQEFVTALERLRGLQQYTVRVRFDRDAALREILEQNPEAMRLREQIAGTSEDQTRPQRIRLGELVVQTLEAWRPPESESILGRLQPTVSELAVRSIGSAEDVVEAAVLVRPDAADGFEAEVERIAEERHERLRFRLVGPQAPYDFVPQM